MIKGQTYEFNITFLIEMLKREIKYEENQKSKNYDKIEYLENLIDDLKYIIEISRP